MRVNTYVLDKTFEAADTTLLQWKFAKPTTGVATGPQAKMTLCTDAMGFIVQNAPTVAGRGAVIRIYGFSELYVDGTAAPAVGTGNGPIAPGTMLKPTTGGIGIAVTAGDNYSAIAMEASIAAGDRIEVLCERGVSHV